MAYEITPGLEQPAIDEPGDVTTPMAEESDKGVIPKRSIDREPLLIGFVEEYTPLNDPNVVF